jgi:hypothetical protein
MPWLPPVINASRSEKSYVKAMSLGLSESGPRVVRPGTQIALHHST